MVRNTNTVMALDGMIYDVEQGLLRGWTEHQVAQHLLSRIQILRKNLVNEEKWQVDELKKRRAITNTRTRAAA